jgi:isopropylmalate/homocitrate/citramalate synthase
VGLKREYVLGKYSGVNTTMYKLETLGYKISREEASELAEIVRNRTVASKRALFDSEIIDTYKEFKGSSKKEKAGTGRKK